MQLVKNNQYSNCTKFPIATIIALINLVQACFRQPQRTHCSLSQASVWALLKRTPVVYMHTLQMSTNICTLECVHGEVSSLFIYTVSYCFMS